MDLKPAIYKGSTVTELVNIVSKNWSEPTDNINEVYPAIYMGDEMAAKNIDLLRRMKITHILNAAYSEKVSFLFVNTSQEYYTSRQFECNFLGLNAVDTPTYKLSRHFQQASDFIENGVNYPQGKILVHCRQGVSRSAALVIIYLMLKKGMTSKDAVALIRKKRNIFPNKGFLKEICDLEDSLIKDKERNTVESKTSAYTADNNAPKNGNKHKNNDDDHNSNGL